MNILLALAALAGKVTGYVWRLFTQHPRVRPVQQTAAQRLVPLRWHRRAGRAATVVFVVWLLVVVLVGDGLGWWLLAAATTWLGVAGPTRWQRYRFTRDAYTRTRKITKDEEYEADHAQNRRHWWRLLRGDVRNVHLGVFWEPMRRPATAGKYVQLRFAPEAPWWPRRHHITQITRRWAREWQPNNTVSGLNNLKAQLEAFMNGRTLDMEVSLAHCYAVFTPGQGSGEAPEAAADLPERLTYPDPDQRQGVA
jgi:hypothetical protein